MKENKIQKESGIASFPLYLNPYQSNPKNSHQIKPLLKQLSYRFIIYFSLLLEIVTRSLPNYPIIFTRPCINLSIKYELNL